MNTQESLMYSVIVPIYKVEQFLPQCVDSVLCQKSKYPFELILVDDGSPDGCGAICDGYGAKDPRVKVIHKKNAGVSAARNTGMEAAKGQYVLFLDGDDYWMQGLLSRLDAFVDKGADTVLFSHTVVTEIAAEEKHLVILSDNDTGEKHLQKNFDRGRIIAPFVWAYLLRTAHIRENRLVFDTSMRVSEDYKFLMAYLPFAGHVYSLDAPLYAYRKRAGSVTAVPNKEKILMDLACKAADFEKYQNRALANYCFAQALTLARLQDKAQIKSGADEIRQYLPIFRQSDEPWARLPKVLFRLLGIYRGLLAFRFARNAYHGVRKS